jgi:replicative DNA helicase
VSKEKTIKGKEAKNESIEETKNQDYTEFFKEANKKLKEDYAQNNNTNYLKDRGISIETQNRFNIGYVEDWVSPTAKRAGKTPPPSPRVIIPTSDSSYVARDTRADIKKYKIVKEKKVHLFNSGTLSQASDEPIFIVEGEIDAMSIIEVDGQAIGLGGVSNINLLINDLEKEREAARQRVFILCLDNDPSGQNTAQKMEEEFKKREYTYENKTKELMGDCKDPNEALVKDKDKFKSIIENIKSEILKITEEKKEDYIQEYKNKISGVIESFYIEKETIETGLKELDKFLDGGLHAGLYVLGAVSGAGKTTFALQIADNMARTGQDVLFFSGEMSIDEMIAKSLSRLSKETSKDDSKDALTMRTILNLASTNNSDYKERLKTLAPKDFLDSIEHMRIVDGLQEINEIEKQIAEHKRITGNTPVVFIDYLQLIKKDGVQGEKRLQIDEIVSQLRIQAAKYQTPIFVISSLNRGAYRHDNTKSNSSNEDDIEMADFKESGGIEYGADVILALNVDNEEEENDSGVRKIRLKILKNRTGKRHGKAKSKSINLNFYAMFNFFEDCGEGTTGKEPSLNENEGKDGDTKNGESVPPSNACRNAVAGSNPRRVG